MRNDWPAGHLAKRRAGGLLSLAIQLAARAQNQQPEEAAVFSKTLVRGGAPFSGARSMGERTRTAASAEDAPMRRRITRNCYAERAAPTAPEPGGPSEDSGSWGRARNSGWDAAASDTDASSVGGRPLYGPDSGDSDSDSGLSGVFSEGSEGGREGSEARGLAEEEPGPLPVQTLRGVRWGVNQVVALEDPSQPPAGADLYPRPEKSARSITPQQLAKQVKSAEAAKGGGGRPREGGPGGGLGKDREWDKWRNPLADDAVT